METKFHFAALGDFGPCRCAYGAIDRAADRHRILSRLVSQWRHLAGAIRHGLHQIGQHHRRQMRAVNGVGLIAHQRQPDKGVVSLGCVNSNVAIPEIALGIEINSKADDRHQLIATQLRQTQPPVALHHIGKARHPRRRQPRRLANWVAAKVADVGIVGGSWRAGIGPHELPTQHHAQQLPLSRREPGAVEVDAHAAPHPPPADGGAVGFCHPLPGRDDIAHLGRSRRRRTEHFDYGLIALLGNGQPPIGNRRLVKVFAEAGGRRQVIGDFPIVGVIELVRFQLLQLIDQPLQAPLLWRGGGLRQLVLQHRAPLLLIERHIKPDAFQRVAVKVQQGRFDGGQRVPRLWDGKAEDRGAVTTHGLPPERRTGGGIVLRFAPLGQQINLRRAGAVQEKLAAEHGARFGPAAGKGSAIGHQINLGRGQRLLHSMNQRDLPPGGKEPVPIFGHRLL